MINFQPPFPIDMLGPRRFQLRDDYAIAGITIQAGFVFDGASVPQSLWWLLPPIADAARAACVHDWIYRGYHKTSRFMADALFRDQLKRDGVALWRRWLAWSALRCFGWMHYRGKAT